MHVNDTTYCLLSFLFHQELCEENSETKTKIQQGHLIYKDNQYKSIVMAKTKRRTSGQQLSNYCPLKH